MIADPGRHGRHGALREPRPRLGRDGRRPGRHDRVAAGPGPGRRSRPRGSASTSTAWPANRFRERFGDAGLLASDLPDGLAIARKRLAALAERGPSGKRLGIRRRAIPVRAARPPVDRPRLDRLTGRRPGGGVPIEARLAAAGLPPLPRTAWLEIDLDALRRQPAAAPAAGRGRRPGPPGREGRRLRPRRGPGRPGARGRRRRRVLRGHDGRGPRAARRRSATARSWCSTRSRAPGRPRRHGRGSRVTAGDATLLARAARGDRRRPRPTSPLEVELEVETGLGRGGFGGQGWSRPRLRIASAPGLRLRRAVDPPPGGRGRRADRSAGRAVRGRHEPASSMPGSRCRRATSRPARRDRRRCRPLRRGPSGPGASTAWFPTSCRGRAIPGGVARRAPAGAWRSSPGRFASRTCRPAGGSATGRPSGPPDRAGSRRCRSATGTAGPAGCRTGRRAIVRAIRVPLVGNVAMDAVMADVTDVPGAPVRMADEFVLLGASGE